MKKDKESRVHIIHGANSTANYQEITVDDLRQEVYVKPIKTWPKKFTRKLFKPKDKRRKPFPVAQISLGAAGNDGIIPLENIKEMTDPYPKIVRDRFTDCALTDPTGSPAVENRNKRFFADGYTIKLVLKSSRADDGHLLTELEKESLLLQFETQYQANLKKLADWDDKKLIKTRKKMKTSHHAALVQGRFLVKHFPPISKLEEGQLPVSLKVIASEEVGNVIIDRTTSEIVAVRISPENNEDTIALPDEMVYGAIRDSGLKTHEQFYGRSIMEPFVQLSRINKRAINYDYAKGISASYNSKIAAAVPVEGTPAEKDEQLKKRAEDLAAEGTDVMTYEADPLSKIEGVPNQTNDEMMDKIRRDIDMILISGMGSTKPQLGRTENINRDTATIIEVDNIRNVRTPDEKDFAEFFEEQLYNPLFAHLAGVPEEELPVKIVIERITPDDETTENSEENNEETEQEEPTKDPVLEQKGQEIQQQKIQQDDSRTPMGAMGLAVEINKLKTIQSLKSTRNKNSLTPLQIKKIELAEKELKIKSELVKALNK